MGLDIRIKDFDEELSIAYSGFGNTRMEVLNVIDEELGKVYTEFYRHCFLEQDEIQKLINILDEGLTPVQKLFFYQPDNQGKYNFKECKILYNYFKDVKLKENSHYFEWFEKLKRGWLFCAENRRTMYFE